MRQMGYRGTSSGGSRSRVPRGVGLCLSLVFLGAVSSGATGGSIVSWGDQVVDADAGGPFVGVSTTYDFARKVADEVPNWSRLSNVPSSPTQPPPDTTSVGACCDSHGTCTSTDTLSCVANGREYYGAGTTCSPNPCLQPGACCLGFGYCVLMAEPWCLRAPGLFWGGPECGPGACTLISIGYCCISSICFASDPITCEIQAGQFYESEESAPCISNPCLTSGVQEVDRRTDVVSLGPPVPNPSRGAFQYAITLFQPREIRISLLDVAGRLVRALPAQHLPAGIHTFSWNPEEQQGSRLASGIYTLRLDVGTAELAGGATESERLVGGGEGQTRRLVLLR